MLTYWQIGKTIKTELLHDDRSEYELATLKQLAQQLQQEYGVGFSYSSLTRMIKFYGFMPEQTIVATVSQQFKALLEAKSRLEFHRVGDSDE